MSPSTCASKPRTALTLLELVIVLGILAALSTVAIRSLEPIADQARYERTQIVLDDMQAAIVGYTTTRSGHSRPTSGFIPDVGVLPTHHNELLIRPAGLIDRTIQTFDSNRDSINDISLVSGWNGPYLNLPAGVDDVRDGWGRALSMTASAGSLELLSFGSDGNSVAPEDRYAKDLAVSITPIEYSGAIVFRLYAIDPLNGSRIAPNPAATAPVGVTKLGVLFYGVNAIGGTNGSVTEQTIIISSSGSFEYRRDNTVAGTTAVRALLWDDIDNDNAVESGETIFSQSIVHYPVVHPGIDTSVELELR